MKDVDRKKRKIQAEMRESWSEQKERKARKEDRKDKKDKRRAAEWAARDTEEIGPVEAFRRATKKEKAEEDGEEAGGFDIEYKTLRREVKEEKKGKKGKKETVTTAGMFDGLD